jgi:hypothetical protein
MPSELTAEDIREINEEGGSVTSLGRKVSALDRPEEAKKSREKVEENKLASVLKEFLQSQGNDIQQLTEIVKTVLAQQTKQVPQSINFDTSVIAKSLDAAVTKAVSSAPKGQRVKDLVVEVIERERDPRLQMDVAKKYRCTPSYEDV